MGYKTYPINADEEEAKMHLFKIAPYGTIVWYVNIGMSKRKYKVAYFVEYCGEIINISKWISILAGFPIPPMCLYVSYKYCGHTDRTPIKCASLVLFGHDHGWEEKNDKDFWN